jgi:hypothetical protein
MQFEDVSMQDSPTQSASRLTHRKRIPGRPIRPGITCRYDAVRDAALWIASRGVSRHTDATGSSYCAHGSRRLRLYSIAKGYLHNHKLINTIDSLQPESPGFDRITIQKAQYWTIGPGGLG